MDALFDRVEGEQFFVDLVERFYLGVAGDPLLRPLYPEDLTESKHHLALFLIQYWGGPSTYSEDTGSSPAAHAPCPVRHRPARAGCLAAPHAGAVPMVDLEQDGLIEPPMP